MRSERKTVKNHIWLVTRTTTAPYKHSLAMKANTIKQEMFRQLYHGLVPHIVYPLREVIAVSLVSLH